MSLHYSDPSLAPRECPECASLDIEWIANVGYCGPDWLKARDCAQCHGTGRINADAQPDVEIESVHGGRFYDWRSLPTGRWISGGPTESAALEAARKALGVRS